MTDFTNPPPLEPGDNIAVIAPASGGARVAPHVFELGLQRLREAFDLNPVIYPTARQSDSFLGENPRARAADIHAAFKDDEIRGIIATIGGSDQLRVLSHLDPDVLRANPTRFFGMSDNTNLGLYLWNLGIISYNGAQLMNELAVPGELPAYTERYCRRAFFEQSLGELQAAERWSDDPSTWWQNPEELNSPLAYESNPGWRWDGSKTPASGYLWGGTVSILEWQLATNRYLPEPERLDTAILCLETSEEIPAPETVGRTLMCLGERGFLDRFAGVVVGRPPTRSFLEEPPQDERQQYREQLYETIVAEVSRYNSDIPLVLGLDWGHTTPIAPLPLGAEMTISPAEERITVN